MKIKIVTGINKSGDKLVDCFFNSPLSLYYASPADVRVHITSKDFMYYFTILYLCSITEKVWNQSVYKNYTKVLLKKNTVPEKILYRKKVSNEHNGWLQNQPLCSLDTLHVQSLHVLCMKFNS